MSLSIYNTRYRFLSIYSTYYIPLSIYLLLHVLCYMSFVVYHPSHIIRYISFAVLPYPTHSLFNDISIHCCMRHISPQFIPHIHHIERRGMPFSQAGSLCDQTFSFGRSQKGNGYLLADRLLLRITVRCHGAGNICQGKNRTAHRHLILMRQRESSFFKKVDPLGCTCISE